ncbi:MAG: glycerophosphodiester phosphodiesterase [Betaproteobacteria bacterium]
MAGLPDWPYPKYCAHRGAGKLAPENTLAAFRLGHGHGYRMAEFDVKLSADGVAFLLHDDTLDRTTDRRGRADALTWRELALADAGSWHSPRYAGEPLASFAAVARWSRAHGVAVNIEIKPTRGRERETGAAIALDAASLWAGATPLPLLSSFSEPALEAACAAVPALPRAWLTEHWVDDWHARATALECVALDPKHTLLTKARVDEIHDAGLRVATWTVNDPARAADLIAWGVDTLITDAVDRLAPVMTSDT